VRCPYQTIHLVGLNWLSILLNFLASNSSDMDGNQMIQNSSVPLSEGNMLPFAMASTRVIIPLCCVYVCLVNTISTTWEIILRDKPSCTKAYRSDADETREINCTDDRIAWVSRPEENPDLQIGPVAISHDGYYKCTITSPDGTFWHGYHLQVLVPPEVTLFLSRNRTAVCKAVAGKPVARISWTPERDDCDTKEDCLANGTVTVQSTCAWEDLNVTTVTCSVSHLTGNKSLCKKLPSVSSALKTSQLNIRPIVILIVLILIIVGSFGFLKSIAPGKHASMKTSAFPCFLPRKMKYYVSYSEKNHPLCKTTNKVKRSQELHEDILVDLHSC
uniref:Ig-like domain-containing protein n=1 Tax=Otolemur garnettii TaxID=30611 RepID=H0XRF0_OTOGA